MTARWCIGTWTPQEYVLWLATRPDELKITHQKFFLDPLPMPTVHGNDVVIGQGRSPCWSCQQYKAMAWRDAVLKLISKPAPRACTCEMSLLLRQGCKCGGS